MKNQHNKRILEDHLSEGLQKSHPKLFSNQHTKNLSPSAKGTFIVLSEIAQKNGGMVPSDPREFLYLSGCPRELIEGCVAGVLSDYEELRDAGLIGGVPENE